MERELWGPERLKTMDDHGWNNQLSRAHGGSQRLKQQSWSLHGTMLNLLHICYGCWLEDLRGTPDNGTGGIFDSFASSWNPFPPIGLSGSALMWEFAPCLILSSCAIGDGTERRSRGTGSCSWDVLCERKINKNERERDSQKLMWMASEKSKVHSGLHIYIDLCGKCFYQLSLPGPKKIFFYPNQKNRVGNKISMCPKTEK